MDDKEVVVLTEGDFSTGVMQVLWVIKMQMCIYFTSKYKLILKKRST